jgi:6-phosphogluconolactonase
MRTIRIFEDETAFQRDTVERIVATLEAALGERGIATLVLTGGQTPRPVYQMMASPPWRERIAWERIHFFWGDERCVPPDDPQSNFGMAWKSMLAEVPASPDCIHRMLGEMEDTDKAARRYEAEILKVLPGPREPSLDLVLLGMGEDGHTASLFPGTEWDEERLVVGNFVPKLGAWRITMTPRLLNAARSVVFLISGAAKARVVAGVLEGPQGIFPAQRISPVRGDLTWLIDAQAGALIRNRGPVE